ncbi:hypothetical protein XELAEV_18042127mg [Xenopus laevis]|uniref:Uncharacterized protein n=1 Tax=Xenopus laevis TaxID=8355 RepID=A0A974C3L7_XENLA|nr:hypothetical protein XELAEV_18042127mg [Xenopus laevis]
MSGMGKHPDCAAHSYVGRDEGQTQLLDDLPALIDSSVRSDWVVLASYPLIGRPKCRHQGLILPRPF